MAEDKPVEKEVASGAEDGGPDFNVKHKLEHRWTLWFDNPQTKQSLNKFGQSLRSVLTFDTVEDFWCLYNNIRTPGQLTPSATFYLFKEHIAPKWEDPNNQGGGCWTASISKGQNAKQTLDAWWLNAVLACIGEQFAEGDEVCGVAVNLRPKGDRIDLWTKTASNEAVQVMIGRQLKQILDMTDNQKLGFTPHADKMGSNQKARDRYSV